MMSTRRSTLAAAAFALSVLSASAESHWAVVPLPVLFYTPETSLGLGAWILATSRPEDPGSKPRICRGGAVYTLRDQVSLLADADAYFLGDRLHLAGRATFARFPDLYFGIGPEADIEESYTPTDGSLALWAGWRIGPALYAGPAYRLSVGRIAETDEGGELASGLIEGSDAWCASGVGAQLQWDTRDSAVWPRRGWFLALEAIGYPPALGSSSSWVGWRLDARSYWSLLEAHVLALQVVAAGIQGTAPLRELPDIGGDALLRGYYDGRYRDKSLLAVQAEYRLPVVWRLGGVLFVGAAQVAPSLGELSLRAVKASAGLGLRLLLEETEHVNLRLDWGLSPEGDGFYLQITEAF